MVDVLTAEEEDYTASMKQSLLVPFIESITPTEDEGINVTFRDQTLQNVTTLRKGPV